MNNTLSSPSGLVLSTNNASQDYDELMECDVENFVEYRDELAEKAIILRARENPARGLIIKPCDSSRYFKGGRKRAKRNLRKRFGKNYSAPGTFVTLTYEHEGLSRWEAWARVKADIRRFLHDITMRYKRDGRSSPRYIWVIEEQKQTGYPHVHIFYPRLRWLIRKEDVQLLWKVGRTRVEYADNVHVGGYVCKYITKMGGWSDEALAFIWKNRIRMYSYSRCYKLPVEDKLPSDWVFCLSTSRTRINDSLSQILSTMPEIDNIVEYLEGS